MEGETLLEDIVEGTDADGDGLAELVLVELTVVDELGEVQASEQAASSGGEGLLGAGVGSGVLVVGELGQEVPGADAVPEEASGLSEIPVGVAELLEELGGVEVLDDGVVGLGTYEGLYEGPFVLHALHELVGYADGHVGLGHPLEVGLDAHELLEVGVVAGHG